MFKLTKELSKDLLIDSTQCVVDLKYSEKIPLMDIANLRFELTEIMPSCCIQLSNRTVHDVIINGPPEYYGDPYCFPLVGECHIFFPEPLSSIYSNETEQIEYCARELVLKLKFQQNCSIFFHEWDNMQHLTSTPSPDVEYDGDEMYLGNSMLHVFIETLTENDNRIDPKKHKSRFYMRSRDSVDTVSPGSSVKNGQWEGYKYDNIHCLTLNEYQETDTARVWYKTARDSKIQVPYLMFDRNKNYWIFSDATGTEVIFKNSASERLYLPLHAKDNKIVYLKYIDE